MYEDYLTKALVGIINAKQALNNFEQTNIKDLKNTAAYNVQQAIEYLLKYCIYNCEKYHKESTQFKQLYTHNLALMIREYCVPYEINVPKMICKNAELYTSWEAESRYSLGFSVRLDSLQKAIDYTETWLVELKPNYKKKINQVNKRLGLNTYHT